MSSTEVDTPYVISGDVAGLMTGWATTSGFTLPPKEFFDEQSQELCQQVAYATDARVEFVTFEEIQAGIHERLEANTLPLFSMDRAYADERHPRIEGILDITRAVHLDLRSAGSHPRPGRPSEREQLRALTLSLTPGQPVALCDDVIFSGGILDTVEKLAELNHPVQKIIAGIGIKEGIDKIKQVGIETTCVREYTEVKDEVCERDFIPGVPMSGRTVLDGKGGYSSAPYILPYGNPEEWATINADKTRGFSSACLDLTMNMYTEIERLSGREVLVKHLARTMLGLRPEEPITIALRRQIESLSLSTA